MRTHTRMMQINPPNNIGWRQDEHETHEHAHGLWIFCSALRAPSKTRHSLLCITSWKVLLITVITVCYIVWAFSCPWNYYARLYWASCRLTTSRLPEVARWQLFSLVLLRWLLSGFFVLIVLRHSCVSQVFTPRSMTRCGSILSLV